MIPRAGQNASLECHIRSLEERLKMKLAAKLILLFVVAVIAVTAMASHFTSKQFFANVENRHAAIAESVATVGDQADFHQAISSGDKARFESIVQTVSNGGTHVRWVWLDDPDNIEFRPFLEDGSWIDENTRSTFSTTGISTQGRRMYFTYVPYVVDGRSGAVEITSPLNDVESQSRYTWLATLFAIAAMGLLSIGVIIIAGVRWIARPLESLTDKMQRVGQGDFSSDLKIHSKDELGQLAAAVNSMCDRLRQQQATIQRETNQRIEAIEQLRHADRLKTVGELAAGFAHEVGTPLNVISGRAEMILSDKTLPPDQIVKHTTAIKTESIRISEIIQKLLDFSRRTPSRKSMLDLRDVIQHSVDMILPLAETRQIEIEVSVPDSAAETSFDFNQMQQVLMNLIDNAIDASTKNQTVSVILSPVNPDASSKNNSPDDSKQEPARRWTIQVIDHGRGIAADIQTEIFQPFFTTKEVGSGTGLGLSIVHGIVEEHDGTIDCQSEPGSGTTITIYLP